jgi:hypothetical protein
MHLLPLSVLGLAGGYASGVSVVAQRADLLAKFESVDFEVDPVRVFLK